MFRVLKANYRVAVSLVLLCPVIFFHSCKKQERANINFTEISAPTGLHLYSIRSFSDSILYACGGLDDEGIILKSVDKGNNWQLFKSFNLCIYDVQFLSSGKVFGVGHDLNFFKSEDFGLTWNIYIPDEINRPKNGYMSELYKIQMFNDTLGFACGGEDFSKGVIYKTSNGGYWQLTFKEHEIRDVLMLNSSDGFASAYGRIYQTTDGGVNWNANNAKDEFFTTLACNQHKMYACGYNGGIYESEMHNPEWSSLKKDNNAFSKRKHYNASAFFDSNNGVAVGANGLITVTHDGFATFQSANAFNECNLHSVILFSANEGICAGDNGTIFRFTY